MNLNRRNTIIILGLVITSLLCSLLLFIVWYIPQSQVVENVMTELNEDYSGESTPEIFIFFDVGLSEVHQQNILEYVEDISSVVNINHVTEQEALQIYNDYLTERESETMLEVLEEAEGLPSSLELTLDKNLGDVDKAEVLKLIQIAIENESLIYNLADPDTGELPITIRHNIL